jgi:hypothetical protein
MDVPDVISQVQLRGSRAEKLKALNASIARLEALRAALAGDASAPVPPPGLHGPYIDVPVWPWFAAGCAVGGGFVLLFVVAWLNS